MSNRNTELALYLAKVEATEGTDAAPTGAANAIALVAPFAPDYDHAFRTARDTMVAGALLDAQAPLTPKGKTYQWTKQAQFRGTAGAPTAGNPFELDPWLQSAGFAATYDATASAEKVTYTPAQTLLKTLTEWLYVDGLLHKGVAARADLSLSFDVGGPCVIEHASSGIFTGATDAAVPAGTFKTTVPPVATDMTAFTVDAFTAGIVRRFALKVGVTVSRRDGVKAAGGVQGYRVQLRKPTWEVVLEEPLIATKDFRALVDANADVALTWLLGATQYNRLEFTAPTARVEKVTPGDDNGLALVTLAGGLYPSAAGAASFTLAVR